MSMYRSRWIRLYLGGRFLLSEQKLQRPTFQSLNNLTSTSYGIRHSSNTNRRRNISALNSFPDGKPISPEIRFPKIKKNTDHQLIKKLDGVFRYSRIPQGQILLRRSSTIRSIADNKNQDPHIIRGKLYTTPSRLLKLILPFKTADKNPGLNIMERRAFLVHPQQPLSYLGHIIQSELPLLTGQGGETKLPRVKFKAQDYGYHKTLSQTNETEPDLEEEFLKIVENKLLIRQRNEKTPTCDEILRVGKIRSGNGEKLNTSNRNQDQVDTFPKISIERNIEDKYANENQHRLLTTKKFVYWSSSTDIGEFVRDAAFSKEFVVEIQGDPSEIRVTVPSFKDRTHYLRLRLRDKSRNLAGQATIKKECDYLAYRSGQRLAIGGFALMVSWWGTIYHFTFQTEYGWDTMEPITYLAGLSTIIMGYLWFLYHNREVSYRSALNLTVSRRQHKLYQERSFNLQSWDSLIQDANALRKEIKNIAVEYDVEWDETQDEICEEVHEALKQKRGQVSKYDQHDNDGKQ